MIAKMSKIHVVVRKEDRDKLLGALSDLGVVHIAPVEPSKAVAEERIVAQIDQLGRALQVLANIEPQGQAHQEDISLAEAVKEIMNIQRVDTERDSRLSSLHRQIDHQRIWGDVLVDDLNTLKAAGVEPQFYACAPDQIDQVEAEFSLALTELPNGKTLLAVIDRQGNAKLPEQVELLHTLLKDNPAIRKEAAEIDAKRKQDAQRLAQLANLTEALEKYKLELAEQAEFSIAARGALTEEHLFALQGWSPAEKADTLLADLTKAGVDAGLRMLDPDEDETPPTLLKYPKWASPIEGLFDILSTFPGYRELDLSCFFMVALPLFAAMLIGDAGYGLVFMLPPILLYGKMSRTAGKAKTNLLITIGAVTLVWGIMSANYFGITPETMATAGQYLKTVGAAEVPDYDAMGQAGGGWAGVGNAMISVAPLWRADSDAAREILIKLSFIFGCIHLVLAHLRQLLAYLPDLRAIAELGWCLVLVAMLGTIWSLFFAPPVGSAIIIAGLGIGLALVIIFAVPARNPAKRLGLGFASSLLPLIGTFGDTMSYIRLMAVGLASYYIAVAFNSLGATVAESATWFAAAPIIVFGHVLNIALAIIAIFAHGVRLNMLEFSNNAGVQWLGYAYAPFVRTNFKEN